MHTHLLTTHIQILKRAATNGGWTEFSFSEFGINHLDAYAHCKELERWELIEFEGDGTELGTNFKPPVFSPATNVPKMAITPNGIRALEAFRD